MSPRLQPIEAITEADEHRHHLRDKTWLTAEHAADYLDFSTVHAFRQWARKAGIATARRGRTLLFARTDLDAAVKVGR